MRVKGTLNGKPFEDLRDGDDLLASVLEVVVGGRYVWLAWNQIRKLTGEPPKTLRDTFWYPIDLELASGERCDGVVPALYCGTHTESDEKMKLGLTTDWVEDGVLMRGRGRRTLYANGEDQEILGVRELVIEPS